MRCQLPDPADGPIILDVKDGKLPNRVYRDGRTVSKGYAVDFGGRWVFFHALEPAYVFARAGRMSETRPAVMDLRVAAFEVRFCEGHGDHVIIHLTNERVDHRGEAGADAERALLQRFVDGVSPTSAHWRGGRG